MAGEDEEETERFAAEQPGVAHVLARASGLCGADYGGGALGAARRALADARVLVVGAGGLGCEILKDLALSGFAHLDVLDMDTVAYSNLNRQFLFRAADVGRPKAAAAADALNRRLGRTVVTAHCAALQDRPRAWYRGFAAVVAGLDSLDARRWLNATLCSLVARAPDGTVDPATVVPLVDGGTEGLCGHVRVVAPGFSACLECSLDLYPPPQHYALCTVAAQPRRPEHCVQYAAEIAWNATRDGSGDEGSCETGGERRGNPFGAQTELDPDNPEHVAWVHEVAQARARECGIGEVTLALTQDVLRHTVPAVASTNALVAAVCANEVFKCVTGAAAPLENYMMYNGAHGVYTFACEYPRKDGCCACSTMTLTATPATTLRQFLDHLVSDPHLFVGSFFFSITPRTDAVTDAHTHHTSTDSSTLRASGATARACTWHSPPPSARPPNTTSTAPLAHSASATAHCSPSATPCSPPQWLLSCTSSDNHTHLPLYTHHITLPRRFSLNTI